MAEEPTNIVLVRLEEFRKEILKRMDALEQKLEHKIDVLDQKVGSLAQTLVGVQRDIRRLTDTVGTLGAAVDEHTHRLDRIEKHLGIDVTPN